MSITQKYFLAHSAQGKLSREAARTDHDLRLLVGHANMLDSLMLDLANFEHDRKRWFNESASCAREDEEQIREHETSMEMQEEELEVEDAQSSDGSEDEEQQIKPVTPDEKSSPEMETNSTTSKFTHSSSQE